MVFPLSALRHQPAQVTTQQALASLPFPACAMLLSTHSCTFSMVCGKALTRARPHRLPVGLPGVVQVSRPSKYHPDWGVLLGPTSPDPTINTSMLSISSGNGTPTANGDSSDVVRKPSNPNRLYISGLPYNWRTQHVRPAWRARQHA
jgi:hypothetical protein